jgi:hypothetical protein
MADNTPNSKIDNAIAKLMKKVDTEPADVAVKIINSAIAWEKVKAAIKEDEPFDPDNLA